MTGENKSLLRNYFKSRVDSIGVQPDRLILGEREISTLETLWKIAFDTPFISSGLVVDLGCGDQHVASSLEQRGLDYAGFDIDDCNLESEAVPLSDAVASLVVSYSVIEHLYTPLNFLNEVKRISRPDGVLFIETPNWQYSLADFYNDYTHVRPYTSDSLSSLLQHNGFQVLGTYPNLRCATPQSYLGSSRFKKAARRPFTGGAPAWVPGFLKGRARGMFVLATIA